MIENFWIVIIETKIQETIEKKMDMEKEDNLKFIEELDKESRQALKNMISIGLDTWKNLSGKKDKDLFSKEEMKNNQKNQIILKY